MDAVQRIKDVGLMLMLAVALTLGLAHMRADAAPEGSSATSATTAACAVETVEAAESDGDLSDEWIDPLEDGNPNNPF